MSDVVLFTFRSVINTIVQKNSRKIHQKRQNIAFVTLNKAMFSRPSRGLALKLFKEGSKFPDDILRNQQSVIKNALKQSLVYIV